MKPLLYFALVELAVASISEINFRNLCDHDVEVVRTDENDETELQVRLKPTEIRLVAYPGGNLTFRSGFHGKTAAVFWLHQNGHDFYALNVTDGYDMDMSIEPHNGRNISCLSENCADAIHSPNDMHHKMHYMNAESEFYVYFCASRRERALSKKKTTTVHVHNNCDREIDILYQFNDGMAYSRSIGHGHHKIITFQDQESFKTWHHGTFIPITLNKDGLDYYYIDACNVYSEVIIESENEDLLTCRKENRPKTAYPPTEVTSQATGGIFYIYWCPEENLEKNLLGLQ